MGSGDSKFEVGRSMFDVRPGVARSPTRRVAPSLSAGLI